MEIIEYLATVLFMFVFEWLHVSTFHFQRTRMGRDLVWSVDHTGERQIPEPLFDFLELW